jgi:hypothetical protein
MPFVPGPSQPVPTPVSAALPVHFGLAVPNGLPAVGSALWLIGVRPGRDGVWLDDVLFTATFGPWRLTTERANIRGARVTGPYSPWRAIGPRLSLADRGLTFGSATGCGVCVQFRRPVPGIEPTGLLRHPTLTVTVAQPGLLLEALGYPAG